MLRASPGETSRANSEEAPRAPYRRAFVPAKQSRCRRLQERNSNFEPRDIKRKRGHGKDRVVRTQTRLTQHRLKKSDERTMRHGDALRTTRRAGSKKHVRKIRCRRRRTRFREGPYRVGGNPRASLLLARIQDRTLRRAFTSSMTERMSCTSGASEDSETMTAISPSAVIIPRRATGNAGCIERDVRPPPSKMPSNTATICAERSRQTPTSVPRPSPASANLPRYPPARLMMSAYVNVASGPLTATASGRSAATASSGSGKHQASHESTAQQASRGRARPRVPPGRRSATRRGGALASAAELQAAGDGLKQPIDARRIEEIGAILHLKHDALGRETHGKREFHLRRAAIEGDRLKGAIAEAGFRRLRIVHEGEDHGEFRHSRPGRRRPAESPHLRPHRKARGLADDERRERGIILDRRPQRKT